MYVGRSGRNEDGDGTVQLMESASAEQSRDCCILL